MNISQLSMAQVKEISEEESTAGEKGRRPAASMAGDDWSRNQLSIPTPTQDRTRPSASVALHKFLPSWRNRYLLSQKVSSPTALDSVSNLFSSTPLLESVSLPTAILSTNEREELPFPVPPRCRDPSAFRLCAMGFSPEGTTLSVCLTSLQR
jgi:hypothetical protein